MSEEIEIGDVVRLNSSATRMTVHALGEEGEVVCRWLDDALDLKEAEFWPGELVRLPKPKEAA